MLTIQFVPHSAIEHMTSLGKIRRLLKLAKEKQIVVLEGRLKKEEEAELIKATMEEIDDEFSGIELAVIQPHASEGNLIHKTKENIVKMLLGNRQGLTILGPSSIVKEIKKDPNKILLFTEEEKKKHHHHSKKKGQ